MVAHAKQMELHNEEAVSLAARSREDAKAEAVELMQVKYSSFHGHRSTHCRRQVILDGIIRLKMLSCSWSNILCRIFVWVMGCFCNRFKISEEWRA